MSSPDPDAPHYRTVVLAGTLRSRTVVCELAGAPQWRREKARSTMMTQTPKESTMNAAARSHYLSRQPLSVLGRIAFGAFLTGTILGGAGALVLTITTGAPSRDILTTTACSLAGTLLI